MTRYCRTIHVDAAPGEAFDFLARFSNAADWDPGVASARMLTPEPVGRGSAFELMVRAAGRQAPFRYEIIEYERPARVVLRAEQPRIVSADTITVSAAPQGGSEVTYDADLRLTGLLRFLDPVLALAFRRIGDRALEGLRRAFAAVHPSDQPATHPSAS